MTENTLSASERRKSLVAIYGATIAFAFTFGLTSPLLSLILESRGVNSTLIGLNGSMTAIGFLVSTPAVWKSTCASHQEIAFSVQDFLLAKSVS